MCLLNERPTNTAEWGQRRCRPYQAAELRSPMPAMDTEYALNQSGRQRRLLICRADARRLAAPAAQRPVQRFKRSGDDPVPVSPSPHEAQSNVPRTISFVEISISTSATYALNSELLRSGGRRYQHSPLARGRKGRSVGKSTGQRDLTRRIEPVQNQTMGRMIRLENKRNRCRSKRTQASHKLFILQPFQAASCVALAFCSCRHPRDARRAIHFDDRRHIAQGVNKKQARTLRFDSGRHNFLDQTNLYLYN